MRVFVWVAVITAAVVPASTSALAQATASPESAALGNCFVMKSTGADRLALVRWFSGALLGSAKTADLAKVDAGKKEETERQVAAIFTRLFTKDCLAEAKAVAATGNAGVGFRAAGEALGRIAMSDLLSDPAANAAMSGFTRFLSKDDFRVFEGK